MNVSELSVSTSKTLFDSCMSLRNPIASSSFSFHSVRTCKDSAYRVYSLPRRPVCRIVHGNTTRESVAASGMRPGVCACASPPLFPPKPRSNPVLRCVGGSVKFESVIRSKGMGYIIRVSWETCGRRGRNAYSAGNVVLRDTILLLWFCHDHCTPLQLINDIAIPAHLTYNSYQREERTARSTHSIRSQYPAGVRAFPHV
jgi:hypothetical protein